MNQRQLPHAPARFVFLCTAVVAVLLAAAPAHAYYSEGILTGSTSGKFSASITVDGSLNDWQPLGGPSTQMDRANQLWIPTISGVGYWIEDGVGYRGKVGPGRGAQDFDHEAGYMACTTDYLHLALVSGSDQWGSAASSSVPGDIFFDLDEDLKWDIAVATTDRQCGAVTIKAGKVYAPKPEYEDGTWWKNPDQFPSSSPSQVQEYKVEEIYDLGEGFIYTNATPHDDTRHPGHDRSPLDHNVVELSLPWDELAGACLQTDVLITAHWTQTCGNDLLQLVASCHGSESPGGVIPEPATLLLSILGLLGVTGARHYRKRIT